MFARIEKKSYKDNHRIFCLWLFFFFFHLNVLVAQQTQNKIVANQLISTSGNTRMTSAIGCGLLNLLPCYSPSVINPTNALVDNNNFARIFSGTGLVASIGSYEGFLEVQFPSMQTANTPVYIRINADGSLLQSLLAGSLGNALSTILGGVLLGNQSIEVDAKNENTLINRWTSGSNGFSGSASVVNDAMGNFFIRVQPTANYNRIRITNKINSFLGLGNEVLLDVFSVFVFEQGCGVGQNFTSYGGSGLNLSLLGLGGSVIENLSAAIDGNQLSFSGLNPGLLNVGGSLSQFIYFSQEGDVGDQINILFSASLNLINLNLFENVVFRTFYRGVLQETIRLQDLNFRC